jgi:ferredoxin
MKVRVDPTRCQGYGRCAAIAPEIFELDDFGFASARSDDEVAADREDVAREAATECPARAITVEE